MDLRLNKKAENINPKELSKGIEVEKEHFKDDRLWDAIEDSDSVENGAEAIAEVHLEESPKYYEFLDEMEKRMKEDSKKTSHCLSLRSIRMAEKVAGVALESVKINNMKFLLWSVVKGLDKVPTVNENNESLAPYEKKVLKKQIEQDMVKFQELYSQVFDDDIN